MLKLNVSQIYPDYFWSNILNPAVYPINISNDLQCVANAYIVK